MLDKNILLWKGQTTLTQFSIELCGDGFCDLGNDKIPHLNFSSIE